MSESLKDDGAPSSVQPGWTEAGDKGRVSSAPEDPHHKGMPPVLPKSMLDEGQADGSWLERHTDPHATF